MGQLTLLLAIHNHQPDGNFGHVFEQAYDDCYRPLIDAHRRVPVGQADAAPHRRRCSSGSSASAPTTSTSCARSSDAARSSCSAAASTSRCWRCCRSATRAGRSQMMSDYLEAHFGVRPEGMWLAERVWEPALAKLIADAGMKFTLVDDGHFRAAGLEGTLRGYYVTEKAGTPLALFPIDKKLREAIPFLKAWESIDVIEQLRRRDRRRRARSPTATTARSSASGRTPKSGCGTRAGCATSCACSSSGSSRVRSRPTTSASYLRVASRRRGASICRRRRTRRWASGRCRPTRSEHYNEVRQALEDRGELERARAVLPRRHLAELPRQVSRGELHAQEDGVGVGQAGSAPRRSWADGGDVDERRGSTHARASSIARSATAATGTASSAGSISTTCATRCIATLIEARGARRARARDRRQAGGDRGGRRRRSADRGASCRTARRRRTSSRTSAAACSSSTIDRSASTCSTCSGGAPRAITGACSRRRASSTTAAAAGRCRSTISTP